jgi:hypothetical protein
MNMNGSEVWYMPNAESKRRAQTPRVNAELRRRCQMPMCRHAEHSFGSATLRDYVDLGASPNTVVVVGCKKDGGGRLCVLSVIFFGGHWYWWSLVLVEYAWSQK